MKEKSIIQQNLKKIIGVIVVSVFAIITIYTVFRGSGISLNELTASLKEASWEGILLASVSMLGFIYFIFQTRSSYNYNIPLFSFLLNISKDF